MGEDKLAGIDDAWSHGALDNEHPELVKDMGWLIHELKKARELLDQIHFSALGRGTEHSMGLVIVREIRRHCPFCVEYYIPCETHEIAPRWKSRALAVALTEGHVEIVDELQDDFDYGHPRDGLESALIRGMEIGHAGLAKIQERFGHSPNDRGLYCGEDCDFCVLWDAIEKLLGDDDGETKE